MEEEDRAAQSAKLQELIRRGTPQDLQEANRLMKVMAGYDTRHKTDYRAKAAEEVSKIQQKARLLEEMLQGHKEGDVIGDGDVFEVGSINPWHFNANKSRNLLVLCKARSQRFRRCVKKNLKTQKPWPSCLRSTTAYIEPLSDIS